MPSVYIKHGVTDLAKWRTAIEEHDEDRRQYGLTVRSIERSLDDGEIILVLEATSLDRAREFAASANLREAMLRAGALGPLEIWFGEPL
ncbi:MAG: hypothetical protein ABJD07_11050 [Gemmatimonadaceae bacterium]